MVSYAQGMERGIWLLAAFLVQKHGPDALVHVERKLVEMQQQRDSRAHIEVWCQIVDRARDWQWSSVRAHLRGQGDGVVTIAPVLSRISGRRRFPAVGQHSARFIGTVRVIVFRAWTLGSPP